MRYAKLQRRRSRPVRVGGMTIGGDAPVTVQSMTNTPTADAAATIRQVQALAAAGADLVRVAAANRDDTAALREIVGAPSFPPGYFRMCLHAST